MAQQQHNDYKNYEELCSFLKGLGLSRLGVTEEALKRYRKQQRKRYDALGQQLEELNCKLLKQTPSNHIYLCDRAGSIVSVYGESETRILAAPLDLAEVHRLWNPAGLCDADGTNVNQRLYKLIKRGKLALRTDLTRAGGEAIPPCSHLVHMDKRAKQAYFVGRDGQTEKLEAALFPFVNLMRRTRHTGALPQDFGCADSVKLLRELAAKLERQLERLAKRDAAEKPLQPADKKVEAMQKLHAMSEKHKKREHKKRQEKKQKKQSEKKSSKKRAAEEPEQPAEPEPQKKQKLDTQTQPAAPQPRPWPRLVITPSPSRSPVASLSASPARSSSSSSGDADSEMTEEVPRQQQSMSDDLAWFNEQAGVNAV